MISGLFIAIGFHPIFYLVYAAPFVWGALWLVLGIRFGMDSGDAAWTALTIVLVDVFVSAAFRANGNSQTRSTGQNKVGSSPTKPTAKASDEPVAKPVAKPTSETTDQPESKPTSTPELPSEAQRLTARRCSSLKALITEVSQEKGEVLVVLPTYAGTIWALCPDMLVKVAPVEPDEQPSGMKFVKYDLATVYLKSEGEDYEEAVQALRNPFKEETAVGDSGEQTQVAYWDIKNVIEDAIKYRKRVVDFPVKWEVKTLDLFMHMFPDPAVNLPFQQKSVLAIPFKSNNVQPGVRAEEQKSTKAA